MWGFVFRCFIFMSIYVAANEVPGLNESRRIYWGSRVSITDAPYMALILWSNHSLRCGANIVHPQFLVSAVHCFMVDEGSFYVKVGTDVIDQGLNYEIERIFIHPKYYYDYYNDIFYNDVSVVKLNGILEYNERISPIELAPYDLVLSPGDVMETFGFGQNENSWVSPYLLRGSVSYIDSTTCSNIFGFEVTPTMMCAEGLACKGDSGGPLVYNNMLVGVVSFGRHCGGALPAVYARVSFSRDFIDATIQANS